jgi:XTP/dITP diphosphohydrolase
VTGNQNKLKEVQQILAAGGRSSHYHIEARDIDLPELQGTPEEVASEKCKLAAAQVSGPVMVEDTSLCFNALNGLPGVYIKWFLGSIGHAGLNKMLDGFDDRSAYAQCVFAYMAGPDDEVKVFVGRTHGRIVDARGPTDFGWDPIFEVHDDELKGHAQFGLTYAEMDKAVKNTVSHRYRAVAKLRQYLNDVFQQ